MSVNHAKEFFKYVLYFKTFLPEPHMAHIVPILKKNLKFEIYFIFDIYFHKITDRHWSLKSGHPLMYINHLRNTMFQLKFCLFHIYFGSTDDNFETTIFLFQSLHCDTV